MKFKAQLSFLILLVFANLTIALHLEESASSQLLALKEKQQYLKDQVKALTSYAANINSQLQNATNDKQKVQILEQALGDQRLTIFDLKNKIVYPFNESQTACKQLTDQQKAAYLQKINITRSQLTKLQQINKKLNQASTQVQKVSDDIQKQMILLQTMEDILNTQCKENLSPTIFQSNLKSKNWILGPQTMNDVKQQYAQRALIFHNITNCPLQTPFYNPESEICIKCQEPTPLFNMFTKQCTQCENDEVLDAENKICKTKPHYTNFTRVKNWNLDGATLPEVDKSLTPCPDDKPYFNGVICVPCNVPSYWSVSSNLCKNCERGFAFDANTRQCEKILNFELTILQNTKWVSQNLTKVLEDRVKVLEENKTSKNYHYCRSNSSPFYDGTTCVSCDYFDIDKLRCVQKPNGTAYDDNMKRFVVPEDKKQTNPNAQRYISSNKLSDSDLVNCNSSFPYFDGIACIQCMKPFDIFNVDEKKCVCCNNDEIYVENIHSCEPRKKIIISQKFDRLLATPRVTVPQYKQSLINTINNNSEAIIYPCQQKTQYSNLTHCFPCGSGEYFNVQTLKCEGCDGVYFDNNQTCKAKVYIFTNLNAPKIIHMDDTTVEKQKAQISDFLSTHPESYVCPIDKPYAIQGKTCGTCPDLFSYSELTCNSCIQFYVYSADEKKCVKAKMLVNFTDAHRILVSETQTLISFKEQEQTVKNENPNIWMVCPGDRPFTDNRQTCFNCTGDTPYFNYTTKHCEDCPDHYVFDPVTVRCSQQFFITLINSETKERMLGYDNYTLADYIADQDAYKKTHPTVLCNASEPFGTLTGCKQCNQPTSYFDIKRSECSDVKYLINFQKISPNYILPSDKNLDSFMAEQQRYRREETVLTKKCPDATPYTSDRSSCFNCSEGENFNFSNKKCEKCPEGQAYMRDLKICKSLFYVTKINSVTEARMKGYPDYSLDDYKRDQAEIKSKNPYQECPDDSPYGTSTGCQQCQQPIPYFDIKKAVCSSAKKLINFANVGNNYILGDGKTLSSYQQNEKNFKLYSESLTVECPPETPFTTDRESCFVCKDPESLYNFETRKCEACPRGAQFSNDKKICLRLFFITNFNTESQSKMIGTSDYGISDFKADQDKLRRQNPYKDCNTTEPYGTLDGCTRCLIPEEYFDIKNRVCTAVRKLINFDAAGNNYIVGDGKTIADYQRDEKDYASKSDVLTVACPLTNPFTSDRDQCFACNSSNPFFDFETKTCVNCASDYTYDAEAKQCVKRQFYTLFTSATERNLLETDDYTVSQYKDDQAKIKSQTGSLQCPSDRPYSTSSGCIRCDSTSPYFNIRLQSCQACQSGKVYFETSHQCLLPAYLTDFSNPNIKTEQNFGIEDARNIETDRAAKPGYLGVKCNSTKPFATLDGCIACDNAKTPYFNIKTLSCEGCTDFYQFFKDNKCNDYAMLTNTTKMIGYFEVDNYTKYNVQKMNNFTFISNPNAKECPGNAPFYSIDKVCVACNTSALPIFNLKEGRCMNVDFIPLSNPQYMTFYIERDQQSLAQLKREIDVLKGKGVNVKLCPQDKPYYSHNECVACPESRKYFDLATEACKTCDSGDKCISA